MAAEPNRLLSKCALQGNLVNEDDNELAKAMVEENVDALAVLIDRYQHLIFTIAFRIVRDEGEAEDLVQEIFLLIYRRVKLFDPRKGIFKVWLLRCAYTMSMKRRDKLKRRKFYTTVELEEAGPLAVPRSELFGRVLSEQEAARFVSQALESLNLNQRKAVELIALEGMTLLEAANFMGCSPAATRNHYYRGVMSLRTFNTEYVHTSLEQCFSKIMVKKEKRGLENLNTRPA